METKTLDTWSFTRFIEPDHSALITGWDEERIFGSSLTHDGQWGLMVELDENIQTLFQSFSFNLLNRSWTIQIQVMFMSNRWGSSEKSTDSNSRGGRTVHLHSSKDTSSDADIAGEWTFFVNVMSFNSLSWCFKSKAYITRVAWHFTLATLSCTSLLIQEDGGLLLERSFCLISHLLWKIV